MTRDCLSRLRARESPSDRTNVFNTPCRYLAARCAGLAGCEEDGGSEPGDSERKRWRRQAREWLLADLATWGKLQGSGNSLDRDLARQMLTRWQTDPELAGLREGTRLNDLGEDEQEEWRALWNQVREVLNRRHAAK